MAFLVGMDPVGLIESGLAGHAFQQKGHQRHLTLAGKVSVKLLESLAIGFSVVRRQLHADEQDPDPLRLSLITAALGIPGPHADAWLLDRGVVAELPEPGCLTFCLGLNPPRGLERRLPHQLRQLRQSLAATPLPPFTAPPLPLLASPVMALASAWRAPSRCLPLEQAAGAIAAEPICPYPPGIPLLIPGERIDPARVRWLQQQQPLWPDQIPTQLNVVNETGDGPPTRAA